MFVSASFVRMIAPYFVGAFVFSAIVGGLFYAGVRYQANQAKANAAQDYIEGTEEARDAENDVPNDHGALIDWLLKFGAD